MLLVRMHADRGQRVRVLVRMLLVLGLVRVARGIRWLMHLFPTDVGSTAVSESLSQIQNPAFC